MRKRIMTAIWIMTGFLFVGISFWFGSQLFKTDVVITEGDLSLTKVDSGPAVYYEKKVSDVSVVNGIAAIADDNGFSLVDEKTGMETQITTDPASSVVFDGKKAYFVQRGIEDRTVSVERRESDDKKSSEVWLRSRMYVYDVSSDQVEPLFDTNGFNTAVIYADENSVFYTDYADENVGWSTGESQHVAPMLYRYDLNEKKRETISEHASKIGTVGDRIVYTDSEASSYRHSTWFYGGGLHVYDTMSNEDLFIDDESEFLYRVNDTLVYVRVKGYDGYGSECDYEIMRCDLDGGNKGRVEHATEELAHHYSHYLVFIINDEFEVYNAITDLSFFSRQWNYDTHEGDLIANKNSKPGNIYTVASTGTKKPLFDISNQLPPGYYATSIFDENGCYCKSEEGINYKFIPFEKGQLVSDAFSKSSNEEVTEPQTEFLEQLYRPPEEYFCSQYAAYVYCTDESVQDYVKMRYGPSTQNYGVARTMIPNFERVTVESTDFAGWSFCYYDGTEGWIKTKFLFSETDIAQFEK